ncbi:MAG TPA: hypothetical protein DCP90_08815 [Clostridiales bacterium]|nr:MAG: hypothetical protein A2Y22_03245 [Clostridiales bacterium GWD2_32_59]HAN10696.1 hypothetical protein [Clostridiales bacterium]
MVIIERMNEIMSRTLEVYSSNAMVRISVLVVILSVIFLCRNLFTRIILYIVKKAMHKLNNPNVEKFVKVLEKPLMISITTLFMYIAIINILELSVFTNGVLIQIVKTIIAISVFVTVYKMDDIVVNIMNKAYFKFAKKERENESENANVNENVNESENNILIPFLKNVYKVLIFIVGFIIVIQEWYDIGIIVAGLGVGGIAIALAGKEMVANLFGSIVIIVEKIFDKGDYIETKRGQGIVEEVGFRSTTIRTLEDSLITIPNFIVSTEELINWSKRNKRRVKFILGITYDTTPDQIKILIQDIKHVLIKDNGVENDTFNVVFNSFGDSSLNILIQYFASTIDYNEYLETNERVNFEIMNLLEKNNVSVAFPSRSLYIEKGNV